MQPVGILNAFEGLTVIEQIIDSRAVISEQEFLDQYLFLKNIGVEIT